MIPTGRSFPRFAPWWSPWGLALRLPHVVRKPSDVPWLFRIGWFVIRLPADIERSHLGEFLARQSRASRPLAAHPAAAAERIVRLRTPWLRLPGLRRRDTCYVRALTLYRFLDARGHDARLRLGAEWFDRPGGVLRGHAWVTLDGEILEGPAEAEEHERLMPIALAPATRAAPPR